MKARGVDRVAWGAATACMVGTLALLPIYLVVGGELVVQRRRFVVVGTGGVGGQGTMTTGAFAWCNT